MGKIKIKSTYPPVIWLMVDGTKRVSAGTILEVNGRKWNKPYLHVKAHCQKSDIVWERPTAEKKVKSFTKQVKGSKGNVYTVTRRENGSWHCTCTGFHYRKNCRHIQ